MHPPKYSFLDWSRNKLINELTSSIAATMKFLTLLLFCNYVKSSMNGYEATPSDINIHALPSNNPALPSNNPALPSNNQEQPSSNQASKIVQLKEWVRLDNRLATLNRTENSAVCLFVWTRLFSPMWDETYERKYLAWVKAVLFESMARQCPADSPCHSLSQLRVVIKIQGEN